MTKSKTLEQLRAEKERAETQLAQEQHKLERLENRKKYLEKGERTKRTHRLCNLGGTVESLAPEIKDLTRTEMTELINNTPQTPTVADFEQRAKAGEAISVTDLAKAVKAEKREQPQKKPSILKKLDEYKKQAAQQPKDKQKEHKKDLEV